LPGFFVFRIVWKGLHGLPRCFSNGVVEVASGLSFRDGLFKLIVRFDSGLLMAVLCA